ncbi:MAG: SgcJ/EcaC family oxidoreductase [Pseudomonadota bacterium]
MNDQQAIRDLIERWIAATRQGDVDAVLQLMAPDAIFLMPGQPPMQGRDAFATSLRNLLSEHVIESRSEIDEIAVSGDMAYCRTRLSVTVTSKHGELPLRRTGHTLSILRKDGDGIWHLTRDANMLASPTT